LPAKSFTDKWLKKPNADLLNGQRQVTYFETQCRGRALMLVVGSETKTFRCMTYEKGRSRSVKLGSYPFMSLADARDFVRTYDPKKAKEEAERETARLAAEVASETLKQVAERWIIRHVDPHKLRTKPEIVRSLNQYIFPRLGDRPFLDVRRRAVIEMLDQVADDHGPSQANAVLSLISSLMGWYATGHEEYVSPIVRGMRKPTTSRVRILTDDEIALLWKACDGLGTFGGLVKLCLLTSARSRKVATMKWADLQDNVWTIATEPREKANAGVLVLPELAMEIIDRQRSVTRNNPFVFPGEGKGRFGAFSFYKRKLDRMLPEGMPSWTIHDLRRTARSLMSRAGVRPDHAERVLGHVIGGIAGIYDRHDYRDEKAMALTALAALIRSIVDRPPHRRDPQSGSFTEIGSSATPGGVLHRGAPS